MPSTDHRWLYNRSARPGPHTHSPNECVAAFRHRWAVGVGPQCAHDPHDPAIHVVLSSSDTHLVWPSPPRLAIISPGPAAGAFRSPISLGGAVPSVSMRCCSGHPATDHCSRLENMPRWGEQSPDGNCRLQSGGCLLGKPVSQAVGPQWMHCVFASTRESYISGDS